MPTICKAILQGRTIVILDKETGQTLASFGVHDSRSVQYRIEKWQERENCIIENYADAALMVALSETIRAAYYPASE